MFSQFFILSLRGDILIFRDFRNELQKETTHTFFRHIKVPEKGEPKEVPCFTIDGVHFIHVKHSGMYFVVTAKKNVRPNTGTELLDRICTIIGDYCGQINEESIRKNFLLIYELVDEIFDFGYPQETATELLKAFVASVPVVTSEPTDSSLRTIIPPLLKAATASSSVANKSVAGNSAKEDIFVDLFEYVNVLFDSSGHLTRSQIEGEVKIRSFLKGNPKVKLSMNQDLVVGRETMDGNKNYGKSVLDYCIFHDCVSFQEWDVDRTLNFFPPDGQFVLFRYSLSDTFTPPFLIHPFVEEPGDSQLDVLIRLSAEFPETSVAKKVSVTIPLPRATASASCELEIPNDQSYEYDQIKKVLTWKIKETPGAKECSIRIKINLEDVPGNHKRELGPISLEFEIPMFICSSIFIRSLKIMEAVEGTANRWVRSNSKSGSYQCRIDVSNVQRPRY